MSKLDALNVASHRLFRGMQAPEGLGPVFFTGFKPDQASFRVFGQVVTKNEEGNWFFSTIVLDKMDIDLAPQDVLLDIVRCRLLQAINHIADMAMDPFDKYVREVRNAQSK